jgi:hypothetical protein
MASFQAPPGHISQAEVMILSALVDYKLTVNAPDADLNVGIAQHLTSQSAALAGSGC